ncbi:hypothetical protein, partial [Paracoccus sp. (in: a-proteobacteria)]|uniref:hypothetical protein n=1 Tax=Paracoccus sp. TaxID=267 RepID=UPI0035B34020
RRARGWRGPPGSPRAAIGLVGAVFALVDRLGLNGDRNDFRLFFGASGGEANEDEGEGKLFRH